MRRALILLIGLAMVVILGLTAAVFMFAPGGTEGTNDTVALTPGVTANKPSRPAEGIIVHGYWTMEVRNPDGSLVERREFENALQTGFGDQTLAKVLARTVTLGGWSIALGATSTSGTLPFTAGTGFIVESSYPRSESNRFKTLTVSVPASGDNRNKLVLNGTATAQRDGSIGMVGTLVDVLTSSESRSGPYLMMDTGFTSTSLSSPVNLSTGQTVTVIVVIGFS
jgi:hypothetical protein